MRDPGSDRQPATASPTIRGRVGGHIGPTINVDFLCDTRTRANIITENTLKHFRFKNITRQVQFFHMGTTSASGPLAMEKNRPFDTAYITLEMDTIGQHTAAFIVTRDTATRTAANTIGGDTLGDWNVTLTPCDCGGYCSDIGVHAQRLLRAGQRDKERVWVPTRPDMGRHD